MIVDRRAEMRQSLASVLRRAGHNISEHAALATAIRAVRAGPPDLVLSYVGIHTATDGFTLLALLRADRARIPVILFTELPSVSDAVRAVKLGAADYLQFPFDAASFISSVAHALDEHRPPTITAPAVPPLPRHDIVAESPRMRDVVGWSERIAGTDFPVILIGETGTGKELFARAIHDMSQRRTAPFVPINCGAIPEGLCEAELFGHRRGAFTGAQADKPGLLEESDGGTLFLDEVVELPLNIQARLLRFLENGEVRRLGETRIRQLNVRVIAAGNRPLSEEVARGNFRPDLFFRLSRIACRIPPLREHLEDIEPIVAFWLPRLARGVRTARGITPEALELLRAHPWPGNVRELRNVLEHAISLSTTDMITEADVATALGVPLVPRAMLDGDGDGDAGERERLMVALAKHHWRPGAAAAMLGISRVTLWRRMRKHGIERVYGNAQSGFPAERDRR